MSKTVTRNDVVLTLDEQKVVRGPNKDKVYFAPTVTDESLDAVTKFIGKDQLINMLQTLLKRTGLNLLIDNTDEKTGVFDEASFLADWANFTSAGGMSKADLEEQFEDLVVEQQRFIETADLSNPDDIKKLQDQKSRILGLKGMIDKKSRVKKAKEEGTVAEAPAEAAVAS